jgi:spermidine/putrescine transport system substrate-binding protein
MDSLSIPANAKNVGALKLINFLLRPDVAKQVAETIGYRRQTRRALLKPEVATINRSTRMPKPSAKVNGRTMSATPAASTKSITRS